ncbi:MAG: RNA methyltransferase [Robiginitomaculum sp.]|nr:RNA methyltransferase [Robiginitomaculum sp.]MDQ7077336.1 RNA methyltransferase [Robiginitomaculum sp.]
MHNSQEGQPAIILVRPQMGENIGAAARVMANFGLTDLRLVCPRDGWPNPKAQAMSAGAIKDTGPVRVYEDVAAAIADCSMILAVSARLRDMEKPVYGPVDGAAALRDHLRTGGGIGLLFGAESSGLNNADVALSDGLITYPVDRGFSSLNLAQAVAVFAYEWRLGRQEGNNLLRPDNLSPAANKAELIGLFGHLESELDEAGFFFPPEKQTMMMRNIQNALTKARLTEQEVRTFRGVIRALAKGRGNRA